MKNKITTVLLLCTLILSTGVAIAQVRPNNLEMMDLQIMQPGQKSFIQKGSSKAELLKTFGQPLKVEDYYFEMDEKHGIVVKYKGANFYYIDDKLVGFDFDADGGNFVLKFKNNSAVTGIGKSVKSLKKLRFVTGGAFYNIQVDGRDKNEALSFEIDKNGKVKRIIYSEYDANQDLNNLTLDVLQKPFDL